jgi:hypothetical protein
LNMVSGLPGSTYNEKLKIYNWTVWEKDVSWQIWL